MQRLNEHPEVAKVGNTFLDQKSLHHYGKYFANW
jgi:hypothetical protein